MNKFNLFNNTKHAGTHIFCYIAFVIHIFQTMLCWTPWTRPPWWRCARSRRSRSATCGGGGPATAAIVGEHEETQPAAAPPPPHHVGGRRRACAGVLRARRGCWSWSWCWRMRHGGHWDSLATAILRPPPSISLTASSLLQVRWGTGSPRPPLNFPLLPDSETTIFILQIHLGYYWSCTLLFAASIWGIIELHIIICCYSVISFPILQMEVELNNLLESV
jgi:hypothetical protein